MVGKKQMETIYIDKFLYFNILVEELSLSQAHKHIGDEVNVIKCLVLVLPLFACSL